MNKTQEKKYQKIKEIVTLKVKTKVPEGPTHHSHENIERYK